MKELDELWDCLAHLEELYDSLICEQSGPAAGSDASIAETKGKIEDVMARIEGLLSARG